MNLISAFSFARPIAVTIRKCSIKHTCARTHKYDQMDENGKNHMRSSLLECCLFLPRMTAQEHIITDRLRRPPAMTENLCGSHSPSRQHTTHPTGERQSARPHRRTFTAQAQAYNSAENDIIILRCFSITGGNIWPNNLVALCDAKRFGAHSALAYFFLTQENIQSITICNLLLFFHKNLSEFEWKLPKNIENNRKFHTIQMIEHFAVCSDSYPHFFESNWICFCSSAWNAIYIWCVWCNQSALSIANWNSKIFGSIAFFLWQQTETCGH